MGKVYHFSMKGLQKKVHKLEKTGFLVYFDSMKRNINPIGHELK